MSLCYWFLWLEDLQVNHFVPLPTHKNRRLRRHWKWWGTFQGGAWGAEGPIPAQMGFWCAASHALPWQLASSRCAESWGPSVGEWGGGNSAQLARSWGSLGWGTLTCKENFFFFLFYCQMTFWVGQSRIYGKKKIIFFLIIDVMSRVWSPQGFVRCRSHVRAFHWVGSAA